MDELLRVMEETLAARDADPGVVLEPAHSAFSRFLELLEAGDVRAAAPGPDGEYRCDTRVKRAILCGFRLGALIEGDTGAFRFCDKHNLWPDVHGMSERGIRIVPGGTTVRRGAYLGRGVTLMPPAYVNIGAWIGAGTMIDSHALVGSCAQVGEHCHVSAAAQIGGVLEPVGALPVVIEDGCFVGGNCGIYEGTHVHAGAVIGAGTVLTRSTPLFDLVREQVIRAQDGVLHVPAGAVVVPGARAIQTPFAQKSGLSAYAPLIVKYRDDKTDASVTLEKLLR